MTHRKSKKDAYAKSTGQWIFDGSKKDCKGNLSVDTRRVTTEKAPSPDFFRTRKNKTGLLACASNRSVPAKFSKRTAKKLCAGPPDARKTLALSMPLESPISCLVIFVRAFLSLLPSASRRSGRSGYRSGRRSGRSSSSRVRTACNTLSL